MDSYERLMEIAIKAIVRGEAPPAEAIDAPIGFVQVHNPTLFRIPQGFPNPPPPALTNIFDHCF